jgi:hypothetical protein
MSSIAFDKSIYKKLDRRFPQAAEGSTGRIAPNSEHPHGLVFMRWQGEWRHIPEHVTAIADLPKDLPLPDGQMCYVEIPEGSFWYVWNKQIGQWEGVMRVIVLDSSQLRCLHATGRIEVFGPSGERITLLHSSTTFYGK